MPSSFATSLYLNVICATSWPSFTIRLDSCDMPTCTRSFAFAVLIGKTRIEPSPAFHETVTGNSTVSPTVTCNVSPECPVVIDIPSCSGVGNCGTLTESASASRAALSAVLLSGSTARTFAESFFDAASSESTYCCFSFVLACLSSVAFTALESAFFFMIKNIQIPHKKRRPRNSVRGD